MSESSLPQGGAHHRPGEGRSFWLLTDLLTFKVVGDDTNGALTIIEVTAAPGMGPPPHIHRDCDESFYVLDGTFEFMLAGQSFTAGAGSFVYLPKGVVHAHRAGPGAPSRALTMQTPSGVEAFVREAGRPATDPSAAPSMPTPSDVERVLSLAGKHGIEVVRG